MINIRIVLSSSTKGCQKAYDLKVSVLEAFCYTHIMNLEYPYQLTAFIDNEPEIGEPVYYGKNDWYPQIALKRRFKTVGISEDELVEMISTYCKSKTPFFVQTGRLTKPDSMPVKVLEVKDINDYLINLHNDFISFMGDIILSRYPARDGAHYLPHVTAEYKGEMVIDDQKFADKSFEINRIFLLKDVQDENSIAYKSFDLT